jgi:hypothetical protein
VLVGVGMGMGAGLMSALGGGACCFACQPALWAVLWLAAGTTDFSS